MPILKWEVKGRTTLDDLGMIPIFVDGYDTRSAQEQFAENYAHGGGWSPLAGWVYDPETEKIKYPGDPALKPLAEAMLRDQRILVYPHAWVAVINADGSCEVSRMD